HDNSVEFLPYICPMTLGRTPRIKFYAKKILDFLIGSRMELTLENRLFNSMALITLFILVFNIPFNYLSGLQTTALIFACLTLIISGLYYLSRFRNQVTISIVIASFFVIILFAANYFFSGGIRGATFLSLMLAFVLITIVSPKRLYILWLALSLLVGIGLLWVEYSHPEVIRVSYGSREALFIDIAFTYGTGILVSFFSVFYLKEAYKGEKRSAD